MKYYQYALLYVGGKTIYYNLENFYVGWNLQYRIESNKLGNNSIEILKNKLNTIDLNLMTSDIVFSFTYRVTFGHVSLIVQYSNFTINFYDCYLAYDKDDLT